MKKLYQQVLYESGFTLRWISLGHIVIEAQENDKVIVCKKSAIVGDYLTLRDK